jgi:hypothetical protein
MKCTAISSNNGKESACYTSPLAQMFATPGRLFSCIVFVLFFCVHVTAQDETNPFTPQATQLVAQIMVRTGSPGFVTLDVANQSSLSAAEVITARKAVETQLRAANVRLVKPERAVAEITVTISENLKGLLWVAEIKQGLTTQIVMLQSGAASAAAPAHMPTLQVRRTSIYSATDDAPVLDFILTDAKLLYVLRSQSVTANRWDGAQWKQLSAQSLVRSTPAPRDLRGHLLWQQSQLSAYLPGVQCTAPLGSDGQLAGIQCREVDDPWPLDNSFEAFFSSNRNFFSGIIRGANFNSAVKSVEASIPPFYSAAAMGDANTVWAFTGTDGRTRLYSSFTQPPRVYSGWGSDIASIQSECGSKWQLVISKPGDRSQPDAVQAMEMAGGEPVPVSAMLEIPGSITAMWRAQDASAVNIITRDPATKRYEASTLTIDCR